MIHILELKNITKSYRTGDFTQDALKQVSIAFRPSEFTAVLGESGSGKTTMLNIIGGLDRYDSGDLVINGKSTRDFKNVDWDAYRNNSVGFIFQSYNLIMHLSIVENVDPAHQRAEQCGNEHDPQRRVQKGAPPPRAGGPGAGRA